MEYKQPVGQDGPEAPKRSTSISGFKVPQLAKRSDKMKPKSKTVQELIREDFKRQPLDSSEPSASRASTGFVKPAGVDGPSIKASKAESPTSSLKRNREGESGPASKTEMKRQKKKKEVQLID